MIDSLNGRLRDVFKEVFGVDDIDDTVSVGTLARWDSLAHITLMLAVETEFDVRITTDEAIGMTDVKAIRAVLREKLCV
ncbi:MAG: hypothetical protein A3H96_00495 [Acidobacteria bacterium RIFCSPLOWO2_02_FULL_67_36]|nr:MAG: hypothetical protein A3H96_00495 [Acidobacteria bacterium RIFCSPLOWO2_02_FULL_67_36]OFW23106.1 MAG: hypothetical protein A3G21_00855 [Acidobacteria bacterium RIFCSPLOWO2_12_FULL_66_21]